MSSRLVRRDVAPLADGFINVLLISEISRLGYHTRENMLAPTSVASCALDYLD
jgi:hypothetical protein